MAKRASCCALGLCILAATTISASCLIKRDPDNNSRDKLSGSLIMAKGSRASHGDLINRIRPLLNYTDEHSSSRTVTTSGGSSGISRGGSTYVAWTHGASTYLARRISSSRPASMTSRAASSDINNNTHLISNDTVVDVADEQDIKEVVNQDSNQRVAALGVIICLTVLGTAVCILMTALCYTRSSGMILLSNSRRWCPIVMRRSGAERQLLV